MLITIFYLSPPCQFILIFSWADYTSVTYGSYVYPDWVDAIGWILALSSVVWIPVIAIYKLYKEDDDDTIIGV